MRWFWLDRFTEFKSGVEASAIKNVCLDEEAVDEYCPGFPYLPSPLIIEGLAQLGGILVAEHHQFTKRVVLAKVVRATFHRPATAGDQLRYRAVLEGVQGEGAMVSCTSDLNDERQADVQLMFAFLSEKQFGNMQLFSHAEMINMLRLMRFFEVATDANGARISSPTTVC